QLAERMLADAPGVIAVITPPTVGMVMARAIDGRQGETVNVGGVLVTEARVSIDGHEGWGMVLGRAPDHAMSVAVVDASIEAGHPERAGIERELPALVAAAPATVAQEWAKGAPTRVQFDVF